MAIASGGNGKLWVGTWGGGLAMFNLENGTSELHRKRIGDPHSLASDIVMDILTTRDGQVWVGTFDHGICWFNPEAPFHSYRTTQNEEGGLPGNLIWSFASEPENKLWIGTNKGLARLNLDSHEYDIPENIEPAALWDSVRKDDIRAILADDDYLWIAARHSGLVRLTLSTATLTPITNLLKPGNKLTHPYIRVMMKDSHGYLWFGATQGLNRFDPKRGELINFMPDKEVKLSLPHHRIRALFEDSKGQIWVGTSLGLMQINQQGDPVQIWQHTSSDRASRQILTGNGIRGLGEDFLGRLWIATEGGVSIINQNTQEINILREQNGLPSNAAYCAIPAEQYMWVSTLRGLARIDIKTLQIESYYSSDGLPDNEFNFNAWHKLNDGRLVFGTLSGFTIFSPLLVPGPEKSRPAPPLQLQTYIYKKNKTRIPVSAQNSPVTVGWENNHIAFEYSALHFGSNASVSYDALLQGVDNNWNSVGNQRLASYTGLAPGHYTFQIRAKDTHGQWQAETAPLHFTVTPPPWQTLWAYAFYALLFAGFLLLAAMLYNRRLRNRAETLQLLVTERTFELEESSLHLADKNRTLDGLMKARERLFHALSHEIRTPLAIIMSVLESVQHNDSEATAKIPMARQSAKRLDRLLDNILELSYRKNNESQDNTPFQVQTALDEATAPYELQAQSEGKTMLIESPLGDAWLALPRNNFEMMISNLLSNSCKYTKSGDSISLKGNVSKGFLHITVTDTGIGIPDGMEESIFDWFERGSTKTEIDGWGIGLAFVREAAEAAGGNIYLESSENNIGAEFLLSIPLATADVSRLAIQNAEKQTEKINTEIMGLNQEKARTLLIIEDDPDLLKLLSTIFPSHWTCLTTSMAETGWKMAVEKLPDLVLTDLMLPGESGFDLTRKLKEDSRTAHIPVIILTALNDEEHRLAGLGLSADSFLTKPFENQELLLRVQGLLANRDRVFERVKHLVIDLENETQNEKSQSLATEDAFLQKLHKAITTGSDLASITLSDAADKLAMSKRSFQREMQRRGISWREYKRMRKLRFAMDLLRDPTVRIGMVAEKAGYSSAAHFSKIFKQYVGTSPTKWQQEKQNGPEKLKGKFQ
jgi:signal transduction histidine kinase/DNA-binding response OmpR family regulator/ligand-binding sensor domain-containing protein